MEHIRWLVNTGNTLKLDTGENVDVWMFRHEKDESVLSIWAKHFRDHYCDDDEIDFLRKGTGYSRTDYLNNIKFPDASINPGPSIRSGDFSEILVADYLEYILNYWVPRSRYANKTVRNESEKGSDVLAFKFLKHDGEESLGDTLALYEVKAQYTGSVNTAKSRLQHAVNHSAKDQIRKAESLNAIKQHLFYKKGREEASRVERFQNIEDRPYKEVYGAAALLSTNLYDAPSIKDVDISIHPHSDKLKLLVIHGNELMNLVHDLYRRAADEA